MAEPSLRDDPDYMNEFKGFLDYDDDATNACFFLVENRDWNLQEESTKINPELCDDGAAQEPQVKGSASCSAINEANKKTDVSSSRNRDGSETGEIRRVDKEEDRNNGDDEYKPKESDDESVLHERIHEMERFCVRYLGLSNYREEAEYREIQRDEETCSLITQPSHQNPRPNQIATSGHTMNPQQQLTSPNRGSTSSTSDGNKISQLSPNAAPWSLQNTCQNPNRSDSEMSQVIMPPGENAGLGSLVTQPSHQNTGLDQIATSGPTTNPQQQLRGPNHGSTSSTSDRNNISQPIGMQSQLSPNATPRKPQNTCQQLPVANQFRGPAFLDHNYEPWRLQNTYQQHPVTNQMANLVPTQTTMPMPTQIYIPWWAMRPLQDQMMPTPTHIYIYIYIPWEMRPVPTEIYIPWEMRPMQDQMMYPYQHPVANQQNLYQHAMANPRMPQIRNAARGQPTQSQGFNTRPSSKEGQDQQQPR